MCTYKIEPADLSDFYKMADNSTESGKPDYELFKDATKRKLVFNGEPIVLMGYQDMDLADEEGKYVRCRVLAGMFRKDINQHTRAVVEFGRKYLESICGVYPVVAMAVADNKVFNRFLKFMDFTDTEELERDEESGIMYHIYVRF